MIIVKSFTAIVARYESFEDLKENFNFGTGVIKITLTFVRMWLFPGKILAS